MSGLKTTLRRLAPRAAWTAARRSVVYLSRLVLWPRMLGDIRGATRGDQRGLYRSALAAAGAASTDIDNWRTPVSLEDLTVTTGAGRFKVRGGSDDLWHVWEYREPAISRLIRGVLRPGDVFVDAGANVGYYSIVASGLVGAAGRVHAVEMMPDTAAILREHVAMNQAGNVVIVERALSDRSGDLVEASVPTDLWGQASIVRAHGGRSWRIDTVTLDEALAGEPAIRLIKMDLEGAEALALAGAGETLRKTELVVFERQHDPSADQALVAIFEGAGFAIRDLDPGNGVAERR